jgi:hypothetical protein
MVKLEDGEYGRRAVITSSRVSFQNRRHYSHRREDFGAAYYGTELMKQIEMGAKPPSITEMVSKAMKPS